MTLTKEMKDLYDKNFKSLKTEIKEDFRRWKDLPCSWMSRISIGKIAILRKAIFRFNAIPIKIPNQLFNELKRAFCKFIWDNKKPRIAKSLLKDKRTSRGITRDSFIIGKSFCYPRFFFVLPDKFANCSF